MDIKLQHAVIRVTSIEDAKEFYVNKLGLELMDDAGNFFAAKAGGVRLSFFEGYEKQEISEDAKTGVSLIFRVDNLESASTELEGKGIKAFGNVIDIPNFHKFLEYEDPDGNILFLAEYKVEPV